MERALAIKPVLKKEEDYERRKMASLSIYDRRKMGSIIHDCTDYNNHSSGEDTDDKKVERKKS